MDSCNWMEPPAMSQTLEQALAYLDMGLAVIPIGSESKIPMIKWKEFQTRLPTHEEASSWPWEGIGMLTGVGSGYVVVDCDTREAGAFWSRFRTSTPMICQTKRGFHFYYQMTTPIRSDVGIPLSGGLSYDVKGVSSYAIVPPTKGYQWLHGIYPADQLPRFNASWRPDRKSAAGSGGGYNVSTRGGVYALGQVETLILNTAIRDAANGRNLAGFRAAIQLRDNGFPIEHAQRVLEQFVCVVGNYGSSRYTSEEARHSVRNAYSRPARSPWDSLRSSVQ